MSDSESIGGRSVNRELQVRQEDRDRDGGAVGSPSYLTWSGVTDVVLSDAQAATVGPRGHISRTGYCALRSPTFGLGGVDLDDYDALMVTCRTENEDGRVFMLGLSTDTYIPGDVYQGYMKIPSSKGDGHFHQLTLPFTSFVLTSHGRLREKQRLADVVRGLEHVTFMIADGESGDFHLDIGGVYALSLGAGGLTDLAKDGTRDDD